MKYCGTHCAKGSAKIVTHKDDKGDGGRVCFIEIELKVFKGNVVL